MNLTELAIENYCTAQRKALKGLSAQECDEIVAEIGVHLRESTLKPDADIRTAIARLGTPEELAMQYQEQFRLERTPTRMAPSHSNERACAACMHGGSRFRSCADRISGLRHRAGDVLVWNDEADFPKQTGLWIGPGIFHFGIHNTDGNVGGVGLVLSTRGPARELLGWWYIPVTLVISALIAWGTTLSLRKLKEGVKDRGRSLSLPPYMSSFV